MFFNSVVASGALWTIDLFDQLGLEIHFVRFAYWSLVDSVEGIYLREAMGVDLYLLILILPMQILCLKFLCEPAGKVTDARLNAFLAPLMIIVWF